MTSKGGVAAAASSQSSPECCMCGDYGIISELFLCKLCLVRSQHSYCSNLYPKPGSYSVCNWCMILKDEPRKKGHCSSNSPALYSRHRTQPNSDIHGGFKLGRPAKKQLSPEKQRRTKDEDQISKRKGVIKQAFKHRVRRYKLLNEVAR